MPANHVLLQRITLTANATSVTFSGIPQTGYTDLKIVTSGRNNQSAYSDGFTLSVNGGTSYSTMELYAQNGSVASYGPRTASTYLFMGHLPGNSSTANTFGSHEIYIPNYTSTGVKSVSIDGTTENNGTQIYQVLYAGTITNGASINSITIDSMGYNFVAGTSFSLYGIANAVTTPLTAPKADGGDIIRTDNTYWYHTFTNSSVFKPQLNLTCDYLVVAGGGGGGYRGGGGGGGGYAKVNLAQAVTANQSYAITVGAGGAASTNSDNKGLNGSDSSFGSFYTSFGGGGGGVENNPNGSSGGNGGGAGGTSTSPGSGTQGFAGGPSYANAGYWTGGGGGTTSAGVGGGGSGGNGGAGLTTSISGSSASYGGGGGGSAWSGSAGTGFGGGGNGASGGGNSTPGAFATGGGGGGGAYGSSSGNGGSGIVIIRYPVA